MVEKAVRRPEWLGSLGCGELSTGRGSFNHKKTMVSCGFNHVWLLGCWHDQMVFNHYKPCFDVLATVATAEIGIAGKLGPCYPLGPRSCGWFQRKSKRSILILLKDALLVKDMR